MRGTGRRQRTALGLLLLAFASPVAAEDGPSRPGPNAAANRPAALESAIDALRLRLQARLDLAALLERQGRVDEAIEVLRGVEDAYLRGWEEVARLIDRPSAPAVVPPAIGAEPSSGRRAAADAVERALRWLAAHQSPHGMWEAAGFDRWCDGRPAEEAPRPDGLGKRSYDIGVTGLALCAFLGAGYTNRGDHPFASVVSKGLHHLREVQDPEGCFGLRANQHYIYNHATAALAMVTAYGMTESPLYRHSAQKAIDFVAVARNRTFGWRYGVKPGNTDTSVTGWMTLVLHSARRINDDARARGRDAPFVLEDAAFANIRAWMDEVTDPETGRAGYMERGGGPARPQELMDAFPANKSESMTAVAVLARIVTGEDPTQSEVIRNGAALVAALPPTWAPDQGTIDMCYWFYGTLAMHRVGGPQWEKWTDALLSDVVAAQRLDGDPCLHRGSWDPIDPWGSDGGRVYSTALMAMTLAMLAGSDRPAGAR